HPAHPPFGPPLGAPAGPPAASRPAAVRLACVVTWLFTTMTALGSLIAIAAMAANGDAVVDMVQKSENWDAGVDAADLLAPAITASAIVLLWCVGAAVLAWFTWRGHAWAWAMLIASTLMAGLFSVLLAASFLPLLAWTAAAGLVLGWLTRRPTRQWFTQRPGSAGSGRPPVGPVPPR
ncbi:hypothetical protein AB4Y76_20905, partial [Marmoricola sp. RAF53]